VIYVIGSLRNPRVPEIANILRDERIEAFDDWYAAGPEADDKWREYEVARGHSYVEALEGAAAKNVFAFDKRHIDAADRVLLVLPAGKSGHLELGYSIGRGKRSYILLDTPDRWDVMYQFADMVTDKLEDIIKDVHEHTPPTI
jgi:nucleoside 2-deoxyribosyltransferase